MVNASPSHYWSVVTLRDIILTQGPRTASAHCLQTTQNCQKFLKTQNDLKFEHILHSVSMKIHQSTTFESRKVQYKYNGISKLKNPVYSFALQVWRKMLSCIKPAAPSHGIKQKRWWCFVACGSANRHGVKTKCHLVFFTLKGPRRLSLISQTFRDSF